MKSDNFVAIKQRTERLDWTTRASMHLKVRNCYDDKRRRDQKNEIMK